MNTTSKMNDPFTYFCTITHSSLFYCCLSFLLFNELLFLLKKAHYTNCWFVFSPTLLHFHLLFFIFTYSSSFSPTLLHFQVIAARAAMTPLAVLTWHPIETLRFTRRRRMLFFVTSLQQQHQLVSVC